MRLAPGDKVTLTIESIEQENSPDGWACICFKESISVNFHRPTVWVNTKTLTDVPQKPIEPGDVVEYKKLSDPTYKVIAIFNGNAWVHELVCKKSTHIIGLQHLRWVEQ